MTRPSTAAPRPRAVAPRRASGVVPRGGLPAAVPGTRSAARMLHRTLLMGLVAGLLGLSGVPALEAQDPVPPPTLEQLLRLEGVEPMQLSLDQALVLAVRQNRDLRAARLQLEEADGQVTEAWGNVFPRIDLNASWTRNFSPPVTFLPEIFFNPDADPDRLVPVAFGLDNQWSSTVSLEQPLFQAQAFIGVGAAGRFKELQNERVRGRSHEVATRVRRTYYQLLLAEEQARLISRSVERVAESLAETRALNRAGLSSDYDVLRLEVELANLEPQLRRAANEALRVEREMVTELDLPEGTRLRVEGALAQVELDDLAANTPQNRALLETAGVTVPAQVDRTAFDGLLAEARQSSSVLREAELNRELRHAELRVEQAEYLPRVSLFANYQVQAQQEGGPSFFGSSGQRGYGRWAGIQVSVPVFTGRQRSARVAQRDAALRAARLQIEVADDRLRDDLTTTLDQVEEARLRARAQRLAVEQAGRGYEIAAAQYREGLGSQLELTDAEVALRQSEFNYAEAVYDYLEARARLDELVGQVPLPQSVQSVR